jgi:thiamine kinase-like enzyme
MRGSGIDDRTRARIAALPPFADQAPESWKLEPLGGMTNRNVKLSRDGESYVVRLAGRGTERYIDREREAHNAGVAAALGLCPEVLFVDPESGTMVSRFVEGAVALNEERLRHPEVLRAVVETLKRLHRSGRRFCGEMRLFPQLDAYLSLAKEGAAALVQELAAARAEAETLRVALERHQEAPAPCHIDPAPHNFIAEHRVDGPAQAEVGRIYLIDWEYSAMCEPMWDIAGLSIEGSFDPDQDAAMLDAYYGDATGARASRLALYKAALDLLAAAWGAVQLADENHNADFRAFVAERLTRFRAATGDPRFGRHLSEASR